ncbi:hypothetical protein D3C85_1747350 [compost metagenome]
MNRVFILTPGPCRSELARDGLKGGAFIQETRVIVNVHREQARSHTERPLALKQSLSRKPAHDSRLRNLGLSDRVQLLASYLKQG